LHRDLKPGNVKITPDGHIFLVDFGLAKVLHGSQATTTGARAMTPGYSPPEQYGTARTDPRTDIYSLGATMYAALSGIIPEDGLARAMDNTQLTPLRKRNNKVSRKLAASIEKAMGIDPADRFQNAEEFKRSLLVSKSKTQRLPGEYIIQPPPLDGSQGHVQSSIERESNPPGNLPAQGQNVSSASQERPVFKPRRRKRKGSRTLSIAFWTLLLLFIAAFGVARYRPDVLAPEIRSALEPLLANLPFLPSISTATNTATAFPISTETPLAGETATPASTTALPTAMRTATLAPTVTLAPAVQISPTPDGTVVAV